MPCSRRGSAWGLASAPPKYLYKNQAFQFIHDLDSLTLLLNMVDAPNIGLLLDVWEVVAAGGSLDTIRKIPSSKLWRWRPTWLPACR